MTVLANAALLASEAAEAEGGNALMWAFIIGGSLMLTFLVLMLITGSYSNVSNKHEAGPDKIDPSRQIGSFGNPN